MQQKRTLWTVLLQTRYDWKRTSFTADLIYSCLLHAGSKIIQTLKATPPPTPSGVPLVHGFKEAYKLWHTYFIHLEKLTRYTLGSRIDALFIECIELTLRAQYGTREEKSGLVRHVSMKFDSLKFFLQLLWEIHALPDNKYLELSRRFVDIGKMIGGWQKMLKNNSSGEMRRSMA